MRYRVAECGKFGNAQHGKFSLAGVCERSGRSENGVFGRDISFSLVACAFWYAFALNSNGCFYSFYHIFVLSYRIFSFYRSFLIFSLTKLIFGALCFLFFLNILFLSFLRHFLLATRFVIAFFNNLLSMICVDTLLLFGMTKLGICLNSNDSTTFLVRPSYHFCETAAMMGKKCFVTQ